MFSLFNTTFLNEDISGATDTEAELGLSVHTHTHTRTHARAHSLTVSDALVSLVFQATGCSPAGCAGSPGAGGLGAASGGLNADMWLRDSGAQAHYYVANGVAAKSPALTRVLQGLLREHARYVLMDGYANSFTGAPFASRSVALSPPHPPSL